MAEQKYSAAELYAATARMCLEQHKVGKMTTDKAVKVMEVAMRNCVTVAADAAVECLEKNSSPKPKPRAKKQSPLLSALMREPKSR